MGQQQLLLIVIGIIVVAVAVIAGFYAMETSYKQNIVDTLVDRNLTIASDAVFWKTKRGPYWGGNAEYTGLATDGMQQLFLGEETLHGTFKITEATANTLVITAVAKAYPEIGVRTYVNGYSIDSTVVRYDGSITLDP